MPDSPELAADLLDGAAEIAKFLGWSERRVYHAAAQKFIPTKKIGARLIARRSELLRALSADAGRADD